MSGLQRRKRHRKPRKKAAFHTTALDLDRAGRVMRGDRGADERQFGGFRLWAGRGASSSKGFLKHLRDPRWQPGLRPDAIRVVS